MAELIYYQLSKDANRLPHGDVLFPPKYVNAYVLTGGSAATTINVPTGARVALFNSTGNFYVNWLASASVPSTSITDGSGPELNPIARDISGYGSFSLVAPSDCIVTIAYFS
jgi:hypothetical protein